MPSASMSTTASKSFAFERRVGGGAPDQVEEGVLVLLLVRADGHELLGEDVERRAAGEVIDFRPPGRARERRALDELIAREREHARPLGWRGAHARSGPTRWSAVAMERGEPDEAGEVHRAHVDAQLQRRGGDHQAQLARLEPLLRLEAPRRG